MQESLVTERLPPPSAPNSNTARSVWPLDVISAEYFCHSGENPEIVVRPRIIQTPAGESAFRMTPAFESRMSARNHPKQRYIMPLFTARPERVSLPSRFSATTLFTLFKPSNAFQVS